jgi:hypothetical protein
MHDLGTFGLEVVRLAIKHHSVIVGISGRAAFVLSNGGFQELNALIPPGSGFVFTEATAINGAKPDRGQRVQHDELPTPFVVAEPRLTTRRAAPLLCGRCHAPRCP